MSCTVEIIITCDAAGPRCHGNDASADMRHLTAARQRANLRAEGWLCSRGKDYCPACREDIAAGRLAKR